MILAWLRRFNCLEAGVSSVVSYNNLLVARVWTCSHINHLVLHWHMYDIFSSVARPKCYKLKYCLDRWILKADIYETYALRYLR